MKLNVLFLVLFLIPIINGCQKAKTPPQIEITFTTTKSSTLKSATIILSGLSVFTEEDFANQKDSIGLVQEDNQFTFTHDLSEEQTTTLLNIPFNEIGLSGAFVNFFFNKTDGQPVQFLQIYKGGSPIKQHFLFSPNTIIEDGKKYELNFKVSIDEGIQEGSIFDWEHVSSTIKEI